MLILNIENEDNVQKTSNRNGLVFKNPNSKHKYHHLE